MESENEIDSGEVAGSFPVAGSALERRVADKLATVKRNVIKPGDIIRYGSGEYEVAGIAKFSHGYMIGIYDEPPGDHIDYVNPRNVTLVSGPNASRDASRPETMKSTEHPPNDSERGSASHPRQVRCPTCDGKGSGVRGERHVGCPKCLGGGQVPTCYTCGEALFRNGETDGWFVCWKCDEAKYKETDDFIAANAQEVAGEALPPSPGSAPRISD